MFMSRDARKVVSHLTRLGLEPYADEIYRIEVQCSYFFPNHIIGVIDKCLSGKKGGLKLMKAQDTGWDYFDKPVTSMLSGRTAAHQVTARDEDPKESAAEIYRVVMQLLVPHDINRAEADALIWDVPTFGTKGDVMGAIHVCKDRDIRSIPYLSAILERNMASKTARVKDRDAITEEVWDPGEVEIADAAEALARWKKNIKYISAIRELNE